MTMTNELWHRVDRGEMPPEYVAELKAKLDDMQATSDAFYRVAQRIGVHSFIEFCGFMNEWIKLCRNALEAGIDYSRISVHGDKRQDLPIAGYEATYIGEKFGCIFQQWLSRPDLVRAFLGGAGLHP